MMYGMHGLGFWYDEIELSVTVGNFFNCMKSDARLFVMVHISIYVVGAVLNFVLIFD